MYNNKINFFDFGAVEIVRGRCCHDFPIHIHKSFCIGKILAGSVNMNICDKDVILTKNQNYYIPSNIPHTLKTVNNEAYEYIVICFKSTKKEISLNEKNIEFLKEYLKNDIEDFSLEELSKLINISKYHLIRKFKKEVGLTPMQYYLGEKIKNIRKDIIINKSLADISFNFGLYDQSHLCNIFKKHMGISPLEFKKSYIDLK